VREFVAGVLESLDSLGVFPIVVILVRKHLLQLARSITDVDGHLSEEVKVLLLFRQEV
jgi:hypothetical protein